VGRGHVHAPTIGAHAVPRFNDHGEFALAADELRHERLRHIGRIAFFGRLSGQPKQKTCCRFWLLLFSNEDLLDFVGFDRRRELVTSRD
jgi:hypothetical protein